MERKKKKSNSWRFLGLTIGEVCAIATFLVTMIGFVATGVHYFDRKFEAIDRIEHRLDKIEIELTKTSDLLDLYLTWRFVYVNDPVRKNLVPVYDPRTRKMEFVSKGQSTGK